MWEFVILFLLAGLTVYRVGRMIATEDGPADVFAKLRWRAGQQTSFGRGLHCPYCVSFWAGLFTAIWLIPLYPSFGGLNGIVIWGFTGLALAGFAAMLLSWERD